MSYAINKSVLELHVPDFVTIKEFYSGLGFKIVWEREPEDYKGYLVLELDGNTLCFWAGNEKVYEQEYFRRFSKVTPRGYGVEIVIMVDDVDAFYRKHIDKLNVVEELQKRPWGLIDFRAVDPAGYYLRFTSEHDIHDPSNAIV